MAFLMFKAIYEVKIMSNNNGQLNKRVWIGLLLFMFIGSIAASIEGTYLNVFLDGTVFEQGSMGSQITLTDAVNLKTSLSAIIAGVTAFIMGTLSEKLKNRKVFISLGYVIWGIISMLMGFANKENVAKLFGYNDSAEIVTTTAIMVLSFSLIMAFLRSTSSDTVFNAWITDVTTPQTTTLVETISTVIGFAGTGIIMAMISDAQKVPAFYNIFFVIVGVLAIIVGVAGFFVIDNPKKFEEKDENQVKTSYWADLFYGFRPKAIKENTNLYLMLLSGCAFNSAFQTFYPYLFIYIGSVVVPANKDIDLNIGGIAVIGTMAIMIALEVILILMKVVKNKKAYSFIPSVICYIVGLLIVSATKNIYLIVIGITPTLIGYITIMIQFGATVRDNIPQDKVGLFQGVRTIFLVLIPMVVGPTLGNIAAKNSDVTYMENGAEKVLPTEAMFLYAAIVAVLIFIPMLAFLKRDSQKAKETVSE